MKPLAVSLDLLQGESNASQGLIIPTLTALKVRIGQVGGGSLTQAMKKALLQAIEKRFEHYFLINEKNRELILASMSLPQFKRCFVNGTFEKRKTIDMLIEECIQLSKEESTEFPGETNECQDNTSSNKDDFYVTFEDIPHQKNSIESDIETEVSRYLCDVRKNVEILNEYPHIKKVYYKHNTTLSSSAPVERLFSQSNNSNLIFRP